MAGIQLIKTMSGLIAVILAGAGCGLGAITPRLRRNCFGPIRFFPIQNRIAVMVGAPLLTFGWWRLASGLTFLCSAVFLDPFGLGISHY